MCTYESTVVDVMTAKVLRGDTFTAWDITKEVKTKLPGEKVNHWEVRNIVHRWYEQGHMGSYTRELGENYPVVTGPQPWVYAPVVHQWCGTDDPADLDVVDASGTPPAMPKKAGILQGILNLFGIR